MLIEINANCSYQKLVNQNSTPALICLDFDGTIVLDRPGVATEFRECLVRLTNSGSKWAVCTGRTLELALKGIGENRLFPRPDFIVAREREIHFPVANGRWEEHQTWNRKCTEDHRDLFQSATSFFRDVRRFIQHETTAEFVSFPGDPAGVVAKEEDDIEKIATFIRGHGDRPSRMAYERNSIYLRFCHVDYNKGSSIRALAQDLGVDASHTFVAGDNLNDLSMLNRETGHHIACPANALAAVKEQVRSHGGHVASQPGSHGIAEAFREFFSHI